MSSPLQKGLIDYLGPFAKQEYDSLTKNGLDPDLAFSLLESIVPEEELYDLPPKKVAKKTPIEDKFNHFYK